MLTYKELLKLGYNFVRLPKGKIQCEHELTKLTVVGSMLTIRKKLSYENCN